MESTGTGEDVLPGDKWKDRGVGGEPTQFDVGFDRGDGFGSVGGNSQGGMRYRPVEVIWSAGRPRIS